MPQTEKIIGRKIVYLQCVSSTNDICFDFANKNEKEGIVVVAYEQTSGRGRFKRRWHSPKNEGLYFSVLLKPKITGNLPFLSLAVSLTVANSLKKFNLPDISIKWPNDVLVNSKKICGILIEKKKDCLAVGIGINIGNDKNSFPDEIRDKATSFKIEAGRLIDKKIVLACLLEEFEKIYLMFLNGENETILNEIKKCSSILGSRIKIKDGANMFEGDAIDFGSDGSLIMRDINDKIIKIQSGEIINAYKRSPRSNNS